MKLIKSILVVTVLLNCAFTFGQDVRQGKTPEEIAKIRTEKITEILDLTPDQVKLVSELNLKVEQKIEVIRNDETMTPERKKEFIEGNRKDQKNALTSILTEEQMAKLKEAKAERSTDR